MKPPKEVRQYKESDYWNQNQEKAVRDILKSKKQNEKDKLYNDFLKEPIDKMIEIIIKRYKLYRPNMTFEETHADARSFLLTKFNKYDPSKNFKSYSYYQTVIKRYLINQINKDKKNLKTTLSYEDITSFEENPDMLLNEDGDPINDMEKFLESVCSEIKVEIQKENINDNEKKIGNALIDIFENWEKIKINLHSASNNNRKFNKNLILSYLRELTKLNTKDIRNSLKRYKKVYFGFKNDFLEL